MTPLLSRVVNATHYAQHVREHVSKRGSPTENSLPRHFPTLLRKHTRLSARYRLLGMKRKRETCSLGHEEHVFSMQKCTQHRLEPDTSASTVTKAHVTKLAGIIYFSSANRRPRMEFSQMIVLDMNGA
uniref:uncharacterized protein LOC117609079 n=1 Tax=Osmia lignaria TaxID=473952 RepID=UPI001478D788|nr:uncharacterized protein LOC117609079 [Osmia lignaria]